MHLFGRILMTRHAPTLVGAYRAVPAALSPIAALGAQTGAIVDAQGNPVPLTHHVARSAGIGAVSGAAAGAAIGLVLGGPGGFAARLLDGMIVGALSGAAGNGALALLGLD